MYDRKYLEHPLYHLIEQEMVLLNILMTTLKRLETDKIEKSFIFYRTFCFKTIGILICGLNEKWKAEKITLELTVLSISECPRIDMKAASWSHLKLLFWLKFKPDLVLQLQNLPQ